MSIKTRIMLFIVGAGFIASLLASVVVFLELIEQPFRLLDTVLQEEAYRVVLTLANSGRSTDTSAIKVTGRYWLEVQDMDQKRVLYRSPLARQIALAPVEVNDSAIARPLHINSQDNLPWRKDQRPVFRVKTFSFTVNGHAYQAQIGRPVMKLHDEIWDLFYGLLAGLIFATLILFAISRYVAGKILRPVRQIQELAQNISEHNLARRIPVEPDGDELNRLSATINHMLDRLQHSFERQRNFLFATSHEFKTPLTTIKLGMDEVLTLPPETLAEQAREPLVRVNHQVFRLQRLVRDLLNLSSLETQFPIDTQAVRLRDIVDPLMEEYALLAENQQIAVQVKLPECRVQGDMKLLSQAFSTLLDNAIRFNSSGGVIELTAEPGATKVVVHIRNTGVTVPEEDWPLVFDPFFRGEKSRATAYGGFGLGLAIARKIITLHQGSITLHASGNTTVITVILPCAQQA